MKKILLIALTVVGGMYIKTLSADRDAKHGTPAKYSDKKTTTCAHKTVEMV